MTTLLALDPGFTTGWSFHRYDAVTPLTLLSHGQIVGGNRGFIDWWNAREKTWDEVVAETFVDDHRTSSPDVTPLRIEGSLDVLWPEWIGQRNFMKLHARDDMLKASGLWLKGQPHATDSVRHALALMKTRRHEPTLRRYWPARTHESAPG